MANSNRMTPETKHPRAWTPTGPGDLRPSSIDPDPPPSGRNGSEIDTEPIPAGYGVGPTWVDYRKEYPFDGNNGWAPARAHRLSVPEQWEVYDNDYHYPHGKHPAPRADRVNQEKLEEHRDIGDTGQSPNQEGAGWRSTPDVKTYGENPERFRPPVQSRSPHTWLFYRDMHDGEKRLNGMHFSMADNIRTYEIGGMAPARGWRNTYRQEPPPRDDIIPPVQPTTVTGAVGNQYVPNSPIEAERPNSWRLL